MSWRRMKGVDMVKSPLVLLAVMVVVVAVFAAPAPLPGDVLKTIDLPVSTPTGLAWDGEAFWVADYDTAALYRISPSDGKVLTKVEAPGYAPLSLAWDGSRLWCLDEADKTAYAYDPISKRTVRALALDTQSPEGIAWDGKDLWVSDPQSGVIAKLDEEDGTTFRSFPSPRKGHGTGMTWDGNYLWAADRSSDRIYQIDPVSGWVVNFFDSPGPYTSGLAWDGRNLWCCDYEKRTLAKLAVSPSPLYVNYDPKREKVVYSEAWTNFGPGTVKSLDVYLAVPQDLPNQKIESEPVYEPKPVDFVTDQWGQRFAHFLFKDIKSGQEARAKMTVNVTVKRVRYFIDPKAVGGLEDIPEDIRHAYLADASKLQLHDPVIQKAVKEAVGGEANPYWIAQKINRYVQEKMHYELAGGWNIAPVVLERGSGSCSEYSFVMIALCRAAGLPARYAGSVVIRGDDASRDDVFHRWVEVYLPNFGWVPVDPSGGDSPLVEDQAKYFGGLDNRFLITTQGGGDSQYLGWDYNSSASWTAEGRVKLMQRKAGEWFPVGKSYAARAMGEAGGSTCKPGP